MDSVKLWSELANGYLWAVAVTAASFGVIGALLHPPPKPPPAEPGSPPKPPDPNARDAPETRSRAWDGMTGAVAAVALLYITNPTTGIALVGGSLVAGFSGTAVLAGLQARVLAAVATKQAAMATRSAQDSMRIADEARQQADASTREMVVAKQDLDHLSRAIASGVDVKPLVRDLRVKQGLDAAI